MQTNRDITVDQLTTQTFYQIPQLFMTRIERKWNSENKVLMTIRYVSPYVKLSSDAKLSYGVLLNRCQLSIHSYSQGNSDYVDENGSVFMIYTVQDLMEVLDKSRPTVTKVKKELTEAGLLREVKMGNNKPNRLYLQNVDATCQIVEHFNDTNTLIKRFDYFGQVLYENEELIKKDSQSLDNSRGKKSFPPNIMAGEKKSFPPEGKNLSLSKNKQSETENNIISSRKNSQNSSEFYSSPGADNNSSKEKYEKYVEPQYYSLLQVIADEYNGKFCQQDLFTGEFQNYSLTHRQKMMIGQYLSEGYVTSKEIINSIDRVPLDCKSPLAYLMQSLENLKVERMEEARIIAHQNAKKQFN
ncbi:replication initiator protein A [Streptococcus dysgalactiae]|uniref:replication initiator protein A n=1 Tax=Streptococcus dysgalactiae TaxID=1334 RepID=UPI0035CED766